MRLSIHEVAALAIVAALISGCSSSDDGSSITAAEAPDSAGAGHSTVVDYMELADEMAPLAADLGWEVQRAYRQDAYLVGRDVDLVNVYLRPIGAEPAADQYVTDALTALRVIASQVFGDDATVTAIDVCLQRSNLEPPDSDVEPAIRILGLREDLAPLLDAPVRLVDLVGLSRERRLVLSLDDYVSSAPTWSEALADQSTTSTG